MVVQPPPPIVVPDMGRVEDKLLKQFISLNALIFSGTSEEDSIEFLRELDKRFRLIAYKGPRRVEMTEFMLRGLTYS